MMGTNLWRVGTCIVLFTVALTLRPTPARAQAVLNPTRAEFNASPDHDATGSNGLPLVQSYEIQFFLLGGALPFQSASLGKPSPNGSNTITVDLSSAFLGWPLPGVSYVAAVAAVGPGGAAVSALSNEFSFGSSAPPAPPPPPPPCSYSLSSTSQSVAAAGGSGSTNVTTASGCSWTVGSNAGWITVSGPTDRTGSDTVNFNVAANSGAARSGTLTVAGQTVSVSQAVFCTFSLSSTSQSFDATGGTGSTTVTTASGCAWTVSSNGHWMTFSGGSNRTGSGTVNFTVAANTTTESRTGLLTIAGTYFTISESAGGPPPPPPAPSNFRIASPG